ncbi:hypothetical protein FRC09_014955 [Ceratobasidium sp. 395]|nr:hypothetical protein FRC09_014955 [Ceratobasidium sp. 395]
MLHQRSFVVSDPHLISELFEKRASNYSDRDASEMVKLVGWDQNIIFLPYGPAHRRYRTLLHKGLSNRAALDYIPIQQHEVRRFMRRLVEEPSGFMDHVRLTAASIAVRIAYGYKIDSSDDWLVQMAEELTAGFADAVTPARWIVDIIPPR